LSVKILEGEEAGRIITLENDYAKLEVGDVFYLRHTIRAADASEYYSVDEPYRLPALLFFTILFVVLVLAVGGLQGIRGLLSLVGSVLVILYVLLPAFLAGFSPILVSILVSSCIIVIGSYITHGFNKTTSSAVLGMIVTVVITGILAMVAVSATHLTGFGSEEAVYLNLNARGTIDILGILLGGIMIGLLGVLYDVAIGQAISVEELHQIAPHVSRRKIFTRAIRIGREHIGALVNTLAIAYVGASLPLLLLFSQSDSSISMILNREIFATEIIRILVGSSGLVLAVPITTLLAVLMLVKVQNPKNEAVGVVRNEEEVLAHFHHH
ncbi:MAG: YibE/F family protein, partial [Patescibacteria group bacterium]